MFVARSRSTAGFGAACPARPRALLTRVCFAGYDLRRMTRRVRKTCFALGVVALIAAALQAAPAVAITSNFGSHYLKPPCCGGDPLNGTRASIRVTNVSSPQHCLAWRSEAENSGGDWLIQAGYVKCASGYNVDGTCSLSNNLVFFVEVESTLNNYACFPHGQASENQQHKFTVDQAQPSGDAWTAFIDGNLYEHNGFVQYFISESAEYSGSASCSNLYSGTGAFSESLQQWQRWIKSTLTWFTVQSDYLSAGCWVATGGPPNTFYLSR